VVGDFQGIMRFHIPADTADLVNQKIMAGTTTERAFVDGLLQQVQDTTIPAVAVESSMYDHTPTSDELTFLATGFLPPQDQNALQFGLDSEVYASQALGLAFAFGDEKGSTAFAANFGPSKASMPNTVAGDAAFASAASQTIFGGGANAHTPDAIANFVANWKAFYTAHGIPGFAQPTADQIDLAARGAAWGDAVGVALENNLGLLLERVVNFLEDATRGAALYYTAVEEQPYHAPYQGGIATFPPVTAAGAIAASVQLTGVAAPDHLVM
jgi:hypothetical protein